MAPNQTLGTGAWLLAVARLLTVAFAVAPPPANTLPQSLLVNTTSALVRGFSPHRDVRAFLGIPYAQPPVGALRFQPPQPLKFLPREVDATAFGPTCVQVTADTIFGDQLASATGESEDCLSVNIWAPTYINSTLLPVFVWVYGGSFMLGSSSIPMYNGLELVKQHQDIVVVSFNYRLNVFGFPNSPALDKKNPGLRDQRFVIEWLQNNIAGFGGDPARMTLGGESAGSVAVSQYAYAYPENPIVRAFIMQSGQADSMSDDNNATNWKRTANETGCASNSTTKELACMQNLDARTLRRGVSPYMRVPQNKTTIQAPAVDNITRFARKSYAERGAAGKFARLPTLMGTNNDEGNGLVEFTPEGITNTTAANLTTIEVFNCPTASHASYWFKSNTPVWRYLYKGEFPSLLPYPWAKAYHGAEIALIFGSVKQVQFKTPEPYELSASRYLQNAWVTFVKDPENGLKELGWPTYNPNATTLVELFPKNSTKEQITNPQFNDRYC